MCEQDYPTEILTIEIQTIDSKGLGYSRYVHPGKDGNPGRVLHLTIPYTVPGDIVRVSVPNAKGRKRAMVPYDELIEAGPSRDLAIPNNPSLTAGTPLIQMKYEDQLEYKANKVKTYLSEAGFDADCIEPIVRMATPNRYRNKMELTFGPDGAIGMHEQGNYRNVIDMQDSYIAPEIMVKIKEEISQWQHDYQIPGYEKDTHTGVLRNLLMRISHATGELMVVIYANAAPEAYREAIANLIERLSTRFELLKSLQWIEHTHIVDRIQHDAIHVLYGRDYIYDCLNGFNYRIWPDTFFQASAIQAERMIQIALELAGDLSNQSVLDLYCGVGTFSLPFAQHAKDLLGIEIVESSIISARRNAQDNGITNTTFITRDARSGLRDLHHIWHQPDLLILNPPRSGAGGKVMRSIGRLGTDKVIYISCNPQTLAQDLVWLRDFGYELTTAIPIDQFSHTVHVETCVLLTKQA